MRGRRRGRRAARARECACAATAAASRPTPSVQFVAVTTGVLPAVFFIFNKLFHTKNGKMFWKILMLLSSVKFESRY